VATFIMFPVGMDSLTNMWVPKDEGSV
jgi:hypothetical protein